jgi:hypothetical protein
MVAIRASVNLTGRAKWSRVKTEQTNQSSYVSPHQKRRIVTASEHYVADFFSESEAITRMDRNITPPTARRSISRRKSQWARRTSRRSPTASRRSKNASICSTPVA